MSEQVKNIVTNLVSLIAVFVLAAIFDIQVLKDYGWFAGLFPGAWAPAYWIMSWFSDAVIVKAPLHTTAYGVWWWIGLIGGVFQWISIIFSLIFNVKSLKS
jgi:hypothetical protein